MSATSAKVHTATTPGADRAAAVSTATMRPCAWRERTIRMCSMWGNAISAANRPRPVTSGASSRRGTERPTTPMLPLSSDALLRLAQRGVDALRGGGDFVDRHAERRQRVIDRIHDRRRRADRAALAQALGLGDGGFRQRLEMTDVD